MQRRGCHKLVHKLISFHHSVTAFHTSHLVEGLYIVRLYARIVNEERHRLSSMCTQFARCGVVGKHGNSHRLVPIFHCLINRPYNPLIQIFNSELFQLKIPLMPCLVTGFDMQIDKVIRPKCFQCSSNLVFIICIIKPVAPCTVMRRNPA